MSKTLDVQELAIVIAARDNNPTILNFDFLKFSDIIPADWELAQQPVNTNRGSQVIFRNGISIMAQPDRIIFTEVIGAKDLKEVKAAEVSRRYVETLPSGDYQAVGINLRGYITLTDLEREDTSQNYILNTLLARGPWQEIGNSPAKAAVQFTYTLERGQFYLSVNEAELQLPEQETVPVTLFTGNFSYNVSGNSKNERLQSLYQLLKNWQPDLETYRDIVNTKFLQQEVAVANAPQIFASPS